MVYIASWEEFVERSVQLFRAEPQSSRYVMKYRHCNGELVLKVTDNREVDPAQNKEGVAALARLKAYEGVPLPYDKMERMGILDALKW